MWYLQLWNFQQRLETCDTTTFGQLQAGMVFTRCVRKLWNQQFGKTTALKLFSLIKLSSQECHLDSSVQISRANISSYAFWFQGGCGGFASFFFGGKLTRPTHPWFAALVGWGVFLIQLAWMLPTALRRWRQKQYGLQFFSSWHVFYEGGVPTIFAG